MKFAFLLLLATLTTPAFADPSLRINPFPDFGLDGAYPPNFEEAKWNKLLERTLQEGEFTRNQFGLFMVLKRLTPNDESVPHQAEYFTNHIAQANNGMPYSLDVSAVSETWKINEKGNWEVDQWICFVSPLGQVSKVLHRLIEESPDRQVLKMDRFPTGEERGKEQAELWGKKLAEWL